MIPVGNVFTAYRSIPALDSTSIHNQRCIRLQFLNLFISSCLHILYLSFTGVYLDTASFCTSPPVASCLSGSLLRADCEEGPNAFVNYDGAVYKNEACLKCNQEQNQVNNSNEFFWPYVYSANVFANLPSLTMSLV